MILCHSSSLALEKHDLVASTWELCSLFLCLPRMVCVWLHLFTWFVFDAQHHQQESLQSSEGTFVCMHGLLVHPKTTLNQLQFDWHVLIQALEGARDVAVAILKEIEQLQADIVNQQVKEVGILPMNCTTNVKQREF